MKAPRRLGTTKKAFINVFLNNLIRESEESGIPIKKEETWVSECLFEYGRRHYLFGAQVTCGLKRISRIASEANQTITTFNRDISGMSSTGTSAAAEDSDPGPTYFTTAMELAFRFRQLNPDLASSRWERTCVGLCVTKVLVGYPLSIYPQFCLRATQDPLSSNLRSLYTVEQDVALKKYVNCWATLSPASSIDLLSLIKDPVSLPLSLPPQPENHLQSE